MAEMDDPERLAALERSGLLSRSEQWRLDTLCETASSLLRAPIAMVNVLKDGFQYSVGKFPVEGERRMPIPDTGCQHVIAANDVVSIPNTLMHPVMCLSPFVTVLGVRSYLGLPIRSDGHPIGTFCVADYRVRDWSHWDIEGLRTLAQTAGFSVARSD